MWSGPALVSLPRVYSCRRQARRGQWVGGGKKRRRGGVCSVTSTAAQSADSEEDNSSRPPLTAIGCGREDTLWAAGSHHLQNQQCYRAAWRHCTTEGRPMSSRSERRRSPVAAVASTFYLLMSSVMVRPDQDPFLPVGNPKEVEPLLINKAP